MKLRFILAKFGQLNGLSLALVCDTLVDEHDFISEIAVYRIYLSLVIQDPHISHRIAPVEIDHPFESVILQVLLTVLSKLVGTKDRM
jgi:hypothetical protein